MGAQPLMSLARCFDPPAGGSGVQDPAYEFELRLLGQFEVRSGCRTLSIGGNSQRVLACLALQRGPVRRDVLGRTLWPDLAESRLRSHLRSVLWRLARNCPGAVQASHCDLRLSTHVAIDVRQSTNMARELIDRSVVISPAQLSSAMRLNFDDDLLPAWVDEDWITADRERFRQLRLHSLEMLCERLTAAGWHGAAVDAGLSSVSADRFRESARRALIAAYLAEGNIHLAISEFNAYCQLLRSELKCEPSQELRGLAANFNKSHRGTGIHPTPIRLEDPRDDQALPGRRTG
jgi:DNA-binding SARP family transcriptional activator